MRAGEEDPYMYTEKQNANHYAPCGHNQCVNSTRYTATHPVPVAQRCASCIHFREPPKTLCNEHIKPKYCCMGCENPMCHVCKTLCNGCESVICEKCLDTDLFVKHACSNCDVSIACDFCIRSPSKYKWELYNHGVIHCEKCVLLLSKKKEAEDKDPEIITAEVVLEWNSEDQKIRVASDDVVPVIATSPRPISPSESISAVPDPEAPNTTEIFITKTPKNPPCHRCLAGIIRDGEHDGATCPGCQKNYHMDCGDCGPTWHYEIYCDECEAEDRIPLAWIAGYQRHSAFDTADTCKGKTRINSSLKTYLGIPKELKM
jgi:hypothetical protein